MFLIRKKRKKALAAPLAQWQSADLMSLWSPDRNRGGASSRDDVKLAPGAPCTLQHYFYSIVCR